MNAQSRCSAFLAIAAALTVSGCDDSAQPVAKTPVVFPSAKPKPSAKRAYVTSKRDEESIRFSLLLSQTVQDDIGLSAEQREKFKSILATGNQITLELGEKLREANPTGRYSKEESEARQQLFSALLHDLQSKTEELQAKTLAILTAAQTERLKQIQLQTNIAATLQRPDIAKELSITKEQTEKIHALRDSTINRLLAMQPSLSGMTPAGADGR